MKELFGSEKNRGVTLIELIVVIAIMAALTGVLYPAFSKYIDKSRKSKDIYTADEIARAVNIAFIQNSAAYNTYQKWTASRETVSVTHNGVVYRYDVYLFASNGAQRDSRQDFNCFNGTVKDLYKVDPKGSDGFYGTINRELGLSTTQMNSSIVPSYQPKREGNVTYSRGTRPVADLDRWRIVKRADNGLMEIWVAQPNPFGGFPIYRLWPEPDDVYAK